MASGKQVLQKSFNFRNMIKLATDKATSDILKEEIDNLCLNRMTNDVAIVQIQFSTPFVTQMKLDVRLSLADKVSNIGEMVWVIKYIYMGSILICYHFLTLSYWHSIWNFILPLVPRIELGKAGWEARVLPLSRAVRPW